jgi:hypothetical protein
MNSRKMKKHKLVLALYFFAGGMWAMVALRDIYAPGFLSMNGRVISRWQIIFDVAVAIVFLSIGLFSIKSYRGRHQANRIGE